MIVYLNADGTIQQVVPQNLTQGSNNQNLIVIGANLSNFTTLNAIFKLPNKQVLAPRLMTKQDSDYVINNEIVNAWVCNIDEPITNFSGTLELTINANSGGVVVNSYTGAVQIAPSNVPVLPSIDESAEEILERIFEAYGAIQAGLLSKQDIYDDTLQTNEKTVVGAINELNTKEMQNAGDIVELRTDVDELKLDVNEIKLDAQNQAQEINTLKDEVGNIKINYATNEYVNNLYAQLSIGGNKSLVFDTKQQFLNWLAGTYERPDGYIPGALKLGDVILLKEQGVPDYWVSSISSPMTINNFTEYEVKIDIEDYATLEQLNALADRVEVVEENLTQITPDVMRALKTPISAPATTKLVAVDTANSQEMITIGENLTLENGVLNASGGSSGDYVTQEDFNKLINNETVINANSRNSLFLGATTTTTNNSVVIGKNASIVSGGGRAVSIGEGAKSAGGGVAIGVYADVSDSFGIAIGTGGSSADGAKVTGNDAIQLGQGTNSTANSFQLHNDNIYNWGNHTLTVQKISLNGVDLGTLLGDLNTALETILGV